MEAISRIVNKVIKEIPDDAIISLGAGLPKHIAKSIEHRTILVSDTGIVNYHTIDEENVDMDSIDGTGSMVSFKPGGSVSDMGQAYALIRRKMVNISILGALQVDCLGNFASWQVSGYFPIGYGGAIDHSYGAQKIIIVMLLKDGSRKKIVDICDFPLSSPRPADMIITEYSSFILENNKMRLVEYDDEFKNIARKMQLEIINLG